MISQGFVKWKQHTCYKGLLWQHSHLTDWRQASLPSSPQTFNKNEAELEITDAKQSGVNLARTRQVSALALQFKLISCVEIGAGLIGSGMIWIL